MYAMISRGKLTLRLCFWILTEHVRIARLKLHAILVSYNMHISETKLRSFEREGGVSKKFTF